MTSLNTLKIQIYADGADKAGILDLYAKPYIKGLTTNPSLMKKAGIKDYEAFAKDILQTVTAKPISLEVFSDEFPEMKRQALKTRRLGPERLRQDPHHQLARRILPPADPRARGPEGAAQHHRHPHTGPGARRRRRPQPRRAFGRLRLRRAHRRHRARSHAADARRPGAARGPAQGRAAVGQRARGAQHLPGRGMRLRTSSPSPTTSSTRPPSCSAWTSARSRSTLSRCSPRTRPTSATGSDAGAGPGGFLRGRLRKNKHLPPRQTRARWRVCRFYFPPCHFGHACCPF